MRRDNLGEYDENEVPAGFSMPVRVNMDMDAIVDNEGSLLASYFVIRDEVPRALARRKCEFLCKIANGDILLDNGKVYKRVASQFQGGRIVVSYDPVDAKELVGAGKKK